MSRIRTVSIAAALSGAAALLWGRGYIVVQKDKMFSTDRVVIRPGDKVVFQNHDDFTHNIYSPTKGNEFNINVQRPGGSTGVTFWTEGEVEVRCAIHPKMKMTVVIKRPTGENQNQ